MWASKEVMLQGTASDKALQHSVHGVFEAQEACLWLKQSEWEKGIGKQSLEASLKTLVFTLNELDPENFKQKSEELSSITLTTPCHKIEQGGQRWKAGRLGKRLQE